MTTEQEKKWREDLLISLTDYRENYTARFNDLPNDLKDEVHGVNYERGMGSDEIISFMVAYLAARKASQVEIDDLEKRNKALKFSHDMVSEMNTKKLFELEDRDQEIERLKAEINELKSELKYWNTEFEGQMCAYCRTNAVMTWEQLQAHVKTCEKHPLFLANNKIKERDELIKGLLKQVPYRKDLASDEIPNSIILQARKMVGEE